jgi:hypothetical protein
VAVNQITTIIKSDWLQAVMPLNTDPMSENGTVAGTTALTGADTSCDRSKVLCSRTIGFTRRAGHARHMPAGMLKFAQVS